MQHIGKGNDRTTWEILEKLHSCTVLPMRHALSGGVDVDKVCLGGVKNREVIVVTAEKRSKATGLICVKHIKSSAGVDIQHFITETILPGSTIVSDRYNGYLATVKKQHIHSPQQKAYTWQETGSDDERLLPRIRRQSGIAIEALVFRPLPGAG